MAHEDAKFIGELIAEIREKCGDAPVVINVGAETGYESVEILKAIPGATIHAFEPNGAGLPGPIWHTECIGATTETVRFYQTRDKALSSTYPRWPDYTVKNQVRLDSWAESAGVSPDCLFIDTEGTTMDVLVGAGDLLKTVRLICAETQEVPMYSGGHLSRDVDQYLSQYGFLRVPNRGYSCGNQANWFWART